MRSLEIFSGAGGLASGLQNAGFSHVKFVEFNRNACDSLAANFGDEKVFYGDIRDFNLDNLGPIDIVSGGPPCQPFSLGGKHKAYQDSRDMFPYAIQTIDKLRPKAFIFENVKGLLRESFAEYFEYIILRLTFPSVGWDNEDDWKKQLIVLRAIDKKNYSEVKYNVKFKLINAANYGVPQRRERVVIVGFREDLGVNWDFPVQSHSEDRLLWDMYVSKDYWARHNINVPNNIDSFFKRKIDRLLSKYGLFEPEYKAWNTIRDGLAGVPNPLHSHNISDHVFRDGAKAYPGHTGSILDWPSKTIKAGDHGVPGGENTVKLDNGNIRYLTVFEAKRLQTFPDEYIIKGSWGEAMKQVGNAVPVLLGEIIGKSVASHLRDSISKEYNSNTPLAFA